MANSNSQKIIKHAFKHLNNQQEGPLNNLKEGPFAKNTQAALEKTVKI